MTRALIYLAILAGVILALVGGLAAWEAREAYITEQAEERGYDRAMKQVTELELDAVKRGRDQERRNTETAQKEAEDARKKYVGAIVALRDAVRAGDRLREQLKAAHDRRARGEAPALAPGGQAADPAGDLLADVQRRLDEATDATIKFADDAHIAGTTCERIHKAVIAP